MLIRIAPRTLMSLQRRLIHLEPIQRIAACAQGLKDEVLHGMLRTTQ